MNSAIDHFLTRKLRIHARPADTAVPVSRTRRSYVVWKGRPRTIASLAYEYGMTSRVLRARLSMGWSLSRALKHKKLPWQTDQFLRELAAKAKAKCPRNPGDAL